MLQDSPVVLLQSVTAVRHYWNHAPASARLLHLRLRLLLRVAVVKFPAVLCTKMSSSFEICSMQRCRNDCIAHVIVQMRVTCKV